MEAEQTNTAPETKSLQSWWDQNDFDGKEFCMLGEDGSLKLKATPFSAERAVGQLTYDNAASVIKALADKFPEVEERVKEVHAEWQGNEDKLKITGKITRLRDYLLHSSSIGDYAPLYKLVASWENAIHEKIEEHFAFKKELVAKAEAAAAGDNWKEAAQTLRDLTETWKTSGYVEKQRNDELWNQLEAARTKFFERKREFQENQEHELLQNLDLKMELVEKAEKAAASESWKETTEVFKNLMDEWKTIGRTINDKNEALWNRFIAAKNVFYDRKKVHFEAIQHEQEANYAKKLAIVEQAEAQADSTDWNATSALMTTLMDEWKTIGRVPAEKTDELWDRFNKAKETFFGGKRHHYEAVRVSLEDNYAQKLALAMRSEELKNSTHWREATEELNEMMTEWKKIGPIPREHTHKLWEQFIAARRHFFDRKDADRERRKTQMEKHAVARAEQAQHFIQKLHEELKEEEDNLTDFNESIGKLTTGPKEEELRKHLEKLIEQTKIKVQRKKEKIIEVEQQMSNTHHDKKEDKV